MSKILAKNIKKLSKNCDFLIIFWRFFDFQSFTALECRKWLKKMPKSLIFVQKIKILRDPSGFWFLQKKEAKLRPGKKTFFCTKSCTKSCTPKWPKWPKIDDFWGFFWKMGDFLKKTPKNHDFFAIFCIILTNFAKKCNFATFSLKSIFNIGVLGLLILKIHQVTPTFAFRNINE